MISRASAQFRFREGHLPKWVVSISKQFLSQEMLGTSWPRGLGHTGQITDRDQLRCSQPPPASAGGPWCSVPRSAEKGRAQRVLGPIT